MVFGFNGIITKGERMNKGTATPWTLHQLKEAMQNDLRQPGLTDFERCNIKAICGKGIREQAQRFSAERKLTPGELAIAQQFGY
jgi:hypothetical protein